MFLQRKRKIKTFIVLILSTNRHVRLFAARRGLATSLNSKPVLWSITPVDGKLKVVGYEVVINKGESNESQSL